MSLIKAFRGLRPTSGRASDVAAPPYDVMSADEARQMVAGRPWSFLHISRPEVDLPIDTNPYAPEVYAKAAENLQHMRQQGVLEQDASPSYYVYRLTMGEHRQTGLVAAASVEAYDQDRIKKHEFTRPKKEDDRVRQIEALAAQTGPVFLVYPSSDVVDSTLARVSNATPDMDVTAADGVRHELWAVSDQATVTSLTQAFDAMHALYVADGHHRSAAASRVAASSREANPAHTGEEDYNYFLSVIFPHNQMQILDYNRVVRDLNGMDKEMFLKEVAARFTMTESETQFKPASSAEFGMYLDGQWYGLRLDESRIPNDPVASLDVSLLANELIEPLLGISDPRRDERIDFVGGIRGLEGLEKRVDSGEMAVAFALYPTSMEALMAVADVGEVMPPKSTWFEPKLADGLVSHILD
ncbi:MAG: DUF1015 domain-containing protein [Gammaproteobacteria bacterium]|nr:DUF1015 domain-containing protein [Gammaproteobacteria bacterium]